MFNSQYWKIKLVYIGFGSIVGCLCTIIGMLASPATAQRDKFQEIECTKLTLIDPLSGEIAAELSNDVSGGLLYLHGVKENKAGAKLYVDRHGGNLIMFSNEKGGDVHRSASIRTTEDGAGAVKINHRNGGGVFIATTDIGGALSINGPNHNKSLSFIGVTDNGESGLIKAKRIEIGKEVGSAELKADKNGGRLDVFGRVDNKRRAAVSISENGNGAVSAWDKNGYR